MLNLIEAIENYFKISINTKKLKRKMSSAAIKKNPKSFYKFVRSNSTIEAGIGPLRDEMGNLETSKKLKELLNAQYSSVFSTPDPNKDVKYPNDFFGHPQANTLSDINITREDITDAIKILSQNTSGGPNEFSVLLRRQCSKSLAHPLKLLYEASLNTGEIPLDLKRAIITPIYKGGSKDLPKN